MTEPKVAREVAEVQVSLWAEALSCDLDLAAREYIVKSVMGGRLLFDDKEQVFALTLLKPIRQDNGETLSVLKLPEPTGSALVDAGKGKNEIDQGVRLVAAVSKVPLGIIERLGQRDINAAGAVMRFFA